MPRPPGRSRITHVITGLSAGGAQSMLRKLLAGTDPARFECQVISLTDIGQQGRQIQDLGVRVVALRMRRAAPDPIVVGRIARLMTRWRTQIVQTWLYHGDLLGGMAARLAGIHNVIWGVRNTELSPATNKRATILVARACARLSGSLPSRIVCCSQAALDAHAAIGYDATKLLMIPNGFDTRAFRPDAERRRSVRDEIGASDDELLIGLVARFDPQKDHRGFVVAARQVADDVANARFVLCGQGVDQDNQRLNAWIRDAGLGDRFTLLGQRRDIPNVMAALDVLALSSVSVEGFPNVLGEAMACGVPCVATDVGDSRRIIGDTGRVVAPGDTAALARALTEILGLEPSERRALGAQARARIKEHYGIGDVIERFHRVYDDLLADGPPSPHEKPDPEPIHV